MKKRILSAEYLQDDGWKMDSGGNIIKDNLIIPARLVKYLGGDREVKHHLHDQWIDILTGLIWPEEAFVTSYRILECTCGAQHTSLPQMHSEWCSLYSESQRLRKD